MTDDTTDPLKSVRDHEIARCLEYLEEINRDSKAFRELLRAQTKAERELFGVEGRPVAGPRKPPRT